MLKEKEKKEEKTKDMTLLKNNKVTNINRIISVITLNRNRLNIPIKVRDCQTE